MRNRKKNTAAKPERDSYPIKDVADRLSLCYRSVHRAVREGRIKSVRMGGAVRISAAELERIVERGF
jgi:excisionase family DNA binding protein